MNNWNFTGRLGQDAELRYSPDGKAIASFSVAVESGYGDKKTTTWPRCAMFGKRGEAVAPYLKKGTQVAISGKLSERKWKDKEGVERSTLEVRVNDLTLIGGKPDGAQTKPNKEIDDDMPW